MIEPDPNDEYNINKRQIRYQPENSDVPIVYIRVSVYDDALTDFEDIMIHVQNVNEGPIIYKIEYNPVYDKDDLMVIAHQDKLESTLVNISPKVQRHEITMTQFKAFRSKTSVRTTRTDGRNKFTVYLTEVEENFVRDLLTVNKYDEVEKLLARTNVSK